MKALWRLGIGASCLTLIAAACVGVGFGAAGAASANAPGITKKVITFGFISDASGVSASTFGDAAAGAQARIAMQNAEGGVDGRKLVMVTADTESSPTGALTGVQELVESKGVFAVTEVSNLFHVATQFLQQRGIPAVGTSLDGPEWYQQPNTNMFNIEGTTSPDEPAYTAEGEFLKVLGIKNMSFINSDAPSVTEGLQATEDSLAAVGIKECDDELVPLGDVDLTTWSLAFKQDRCDGADCVCILNSTIAMSTVLNNLGLKVPEIYAAGPTPDLFTSPETLKVAQGAYFPVAWDPSFQSAGGKATIAAFKKYDPTYTAGEVPDLGLIDGWEVADLFIKGMEVAGPNPTRQSFIANLRKVNNWSAEGLRPSPVSFQHFGQAAKTSCSFYVQLKGSKYVPFPASGKPICGTLLKKSTIPT